jgi:hypothetical protein
MFAACMNQCSMGAVMFKRMVFIAAQLTLPLSCSCFLVVRCACLCCLQLLDELLKEEHVMGVIGCLEYDPDLQTPQQHRNFLQTAVVFKEVVPITSQVC